MYRQFDNSYIEIGEEIKKFFSPESKARGFFVEAGAFDGESCSHSLYLEMELGWTGLLVEPNRNAFQSLQSKHRKAWSCHCCLSPKSYPTEELLSTFQGANYYANQMSTTGRNKDAYIRSQFGYVNYEKIQCFPPQTLLSAINLTHVDLFILDTEDLELLILERFPWSEIDVTIWIIEHRTPSNIMMTKDTKDKDFIQMFSSLGYYLYRIGNILPLNYYFIKRNSTFYHDNKRRLNLQ